MSSTDEEALPPEVLELRLECSKVFEEQGKDAGFAWLRSLEEGALRSEFRILKKSPIQPDEMDHVLELIGLGEKTDGTGMWKSAAEAIGNAYGKDESGIRWLYKNKFLVKTTTTKKQQQLPPQPQPPRPPHHSTKPSQQQPPLQLPQQHGSNILIQEEESDEENEAPSDLKPVAVDAQILLLEAENTQLKDELKALEEGYQCLVKFEHREHEYESREQELERREQELERRKQELERREQELERRAQEVEHRSKQEVERREKVRSDTLEAENATLKQEAVTRAQEIAILQSQVDFQIEKNKVSEKRIIVEGIKNYHSVQALWMAMTKMMEMTIVPLQETLVQAESDGSPSLLLHGLLEKETDLIEKSETLIANTLASVDQRSKELRGRIFCNRQHANQVLDLLGAMMEQIPSAAKLADVYSKIFDSGEFDDRVNWLVSLAEGVRNENFAQVGNTVDKCILTFTKISPFKHFVVTGDATTIRECASFFASLIGIAKNFEDPTTTDKQRKDFLELLANHTLEPSLHWVENASLYADLLNSISPAMGFFVIDPQFERFVNNYDQEGTYDQEDLRLLIEEVVRMRSALADVLVDSSNISNGVDHSVGGSESVEESLSFNTAESEGEGESLEEDSIETNDESCSSTDGSHLSTTN